MNIGRSDNNNSNNKKKRFFLHRKNGMPAVRSVKLFLFRLFNFFCALYSHFDSFWPPLVCRVYNLNMFFVTDIYFGNSFKI